MLGSVCASFLLSVHLHFLYDCGGGEGEGRPCGSPEMTACPQSLLMESWRSRIVLSALRLIHMTLKLYLSEGGTPSLFEKPPQHVECLLTHTSRGSEASYCRSTGCNRPHHRHNHLRLRHPPLARCNLAVREGRPLGTRIHRHCRVRRPIRA